MRNSSFKRIQERCNHSSSQQRTHSSSSGATPLRIHSTHDRPHTQLPSISLFIHGLNPPDRPIQDKTLVAVGTRQGDVSPSQRLHHRHEPILNATLKKSLHGFTRLRQDVVTVMIYRRFQRYVEPVFDSFIHFRRRVVLRVDREIFIFFKPCNASRCVHHLFLVMILVVALTAISTVPTCIPLALQINYRSIEFSMIWGFM